MGTTQKKTYRNTFSGSVGAGMGSLFSPGGRKYYILEHKVTSKYHRAGESQEIIVDNIQIGRDSVCQVRFDENFKTVSRRHAAIVRDGDNWKLVQLSQTNRTFLNGHPVSSEWYLQNGDEIQLSVNGPKLGFIIPTGNKATVGSIGLTRRMSLFRQQALRPYKTAITVIASILVLCVLAGSFVIYNQGQKIANNEAELIAANERNAKNEKLIKQQDKIIKNQNGVLDSLKKEVHVAKIKAEEARKAARKVDPIVNNDMSSCHPHVYHITSSVEIDGLEMNQWIGTGFQLDDGKFVTARHVVTPYYSNSYIIRDGVVLANPAVDPRLVFLELLANVLFQQGRATIKFKAMSYNQSFSFTSDQIVHESRYDEVHILEEPFRVEVNGETLEIPAGTNIRVGAGGALDFAYIKRNDAGLKANYELSNNLKQGTKLHVLGYPHNYAKGDKPIYSEAICSQNGLSKDLGGCIMASNDNSESGNSGGPIFVKSENGTGWEVVAIVSGGNYEKGRFVPISVIQ